MFRVERPEAEVKGLDSFALQSIVSVAVHAGMKRISSTPDLRESGSSLHHPAIHKVTPRGSPTEHPWARKRHHTHLQPSASFDSSLHV